MTYQDYGYYIRYQPFDCHVKKVEACPSHQATFSHLIIHIILSPYVNIYDYKERCLKNIHLQKQQYIHKHVLHC